MSEKVQTFRVTSGRVTGVIGLVMCVTVAVLFVLTEPPAAAVAGGLGCGFVAVLSWAALLRPRVAATAEELWMWTLLQKVAIPLASIDTVLVRRYLVVRAGGVKYICPAIGRSLRQTARTEMKWQGSSQMLAPGMQINDERIAAQTDVKDTKELAYADFVETEIVRLADADRLRRGIEPRSEEEYELGAQVRRQWARLEIGALVVLGVAFVISLFLL
jgi:hypothetical protein